jgi:hypothetical protein
MKKNVLLGMIFLPLAIWILVFTATLVLIVFDVPIQNFDLNKLFLRTAAVGISYIVVCLLFTGILSIKDL